MMLGGMSDRPGWNRRGSFDGVECHVINSQWWQRSGERSVMNRRTRVKVVTRCKTAKDGDALVKDVISYLTMTKIFSNSLEETYREKINTIN